MIMTQKCNKIANIFLINHFIGNRLMLAPDRHGTLANLGGNTNGLVNKQNVSRAEQSFCFWVRTFLPRQLPNQQQQQQQNLKRPSFAYCGGRAFFGNHTLSLHT